MYSTCLFCTQSLGKNEVLERFPVGRRLAFDPAKGRLWVVCAKCERWNLTPLETRWEAIEDADREYRSAPLRVSTDNIGLAQLREGLELVRLGAPPREEFAAWRYGDQYGRRRRKHALLGAAAGIAGVAMLLPSASLVGVTLAPGLLVGMSAFQMAHMVTDVIRTRRNMRKPRLVLRDDTDEPLVLTNDCARGLSLVPVGDIGWKLKVPHRHQKFDPERRGHPRARVTTSPFGREAVLTGAAALRALAMCMPQINRRGASTRAVREATDVVGASRTLDDLLRSASTNEDAQKTGWSGSDRIYVSHLPARIRLALEMALHEDDERRAMEGELAALEQRWRDADAIATIADSLTLPDEIDARFAALAQKAAPPSG